MSTDRYLKRTIVGLKLHATMIAGVPFVPVDNDTLNQKFNVHKNIEPNSGLYPVFNYFCIGNGALDTVIDADGDSNVTNKEHDAADSALFKHIPFVMRPVGDDLTTAERVRYGLRVLMTVGTESYWGYFLKVVERITDQPTVNKIVIENGVELPPVPYVPAASSLNPTPPVIPIGSAATTDGTFYDVALSYRIPMDSNDLAELRNVSLILKGNDTAITVSEIGLVCSYKQPVPLLDQTNTPTSTNYVESIRSVIAYHYPTTIPLQSVNSDASDIINIGGTDPAVGVTV